MNDTTDKGRVSDISSALAARKIRSSVRALIVKEGKILCNLNKRNGEEYYTLPGGGQDLGEDLETALKREVKEEVGCDLSIHELVFVYDYIAAKDPHQYRKNPSYHALQHIFWCELIDPHNLGKDVQMDEYQVGHKWIKLMELQEKNFYPKELVSALQNPKDAKIYLGELY